jgi:hypothetical protein
MSFATADLCDAHEDQLALGTLRVLEPVFRLLGRAACFSGPAVTLKVFEDNVLVRATLEQQGAGRVLVVDGGGSTRCAIVGGNSRRSRSETAGRASFSTAAYAIRSNSTRSTSALRRPPPVRDAVKSAAPASGMCQSACRGRSCGRVNGPSRM